jgi:hypothetical protein
MNIQKRCLVAVIASILAAAPVTVPGQTATAAAAPSASPCPTDALTQGTNTVSNAATTMSKDTTTLASAGTQLNTAEDKFNSMLSGWKKPKTPAPAKAASTTPKTTTTTTATNTTTAKLSQVSSATNSAGTTDKAPCKPAGAAGAKETAGGQPGTTKPIEKADVAAAAGAPTFTLMPDGDYMLGYTGTGAGAAPTYAKVKQISPAATPSAANPHDGVYTDGKAYFMVTSGKLTVTPIGGVASK